MRGLKFFILGLLLMACSPGFDEPWDVYDLRIIGMKLDPPEHVYKILVDEETGMPELDPGSLILPPITLTILVANPEAPEVPFQYRVEGCLLDGSLNCVDDEFRTLFAEGEALPGEVSVEFMPPMELMVKSLEEDPFLGIYGFSIWVAGTITVGDSSIPFLKSFSVVPDYGQGRVANTNPVITEIWAGEEDEEEPLKLAADGTFEPAASEDIRLLPVFPEDVRETYVVKAINLATFEFTADTSFEAVWEQAYDKELTEEMTVSYFTTCGSFSDASKSEMINIAIETEEDKEDKELGSEFRVPESGTCTIWVVAADGRGGVGWYELPVAVQ
jgi:hypothetical protein